MPRVSWAFYACLAFVTLLAVVGGWAVWDHLAARKLGLAIKRLDELQTTSLGSDPYPFTGLIGGGEADIPYRALKDLPGAASSIPLLKQFLEESQENVETLFTVEKFVEIGAHLSAHAELIRELKAGDPWCAWSTKGDSDHGDLGLCVSRYAELLTIDAKFAVHEGRGDDAVTSLKTALSLVDALIVLPLKGGPDPRTLPTARRVLSVMRDLFPHLHSSKSFHLEDLRDHLGWWSFKDGFKARYKAEALEHLAFFHRFQAPPLDMRLPWQFRSFVGRAIRNRQFAEHLDLWIRCIEAMDRSYPEALSEMKAASVECRRAPEWFAEVFGNTASDVAGRFELLGNIDVELALARAAIDVELHRIRTGRLPEKIEPPVLDPISGLPIEYSPEAFWISSSTGQRWYLRRN